MAIFTGSPHLHVNWTTPSNPPRTTIPGHGTSIPLVMWVQGAAPQSMRLVQWVAAPARLVIRAQGQPAPPGINDGPAVEPDPSNPVGRTDQVRPLATWSAWLAMHQVSRRCAAFIADICAAQNAP